MKYLLTLTLALSCFLSIAQTDRDKLIGEWKLYLNDNINFEFLRLNPDGTGIKCFGQTINGKDSIFESHITTLLITNWKVDKKNLIIQSNNTLSYDINPDYKLALMNDDKIQLEGEHLIFNLFPSWLNRKEFNRTITYQRANKITLDHGTTVATCITGQKIFSFTPVNSSTQIAEYIGFLDLIPHIISCSPGYIYTQKYYDRPYSLTIPIFIKRWSYGFGNKNFYISLNSGESDDPETSIVIYYDFDNELRNFFFDQMEKGIVEKTIVKQSGLEIYKTHYNQDKQEGRLFLDNFIVIMYYTRNEKNEELLQKCISSFKYK